MDEWKPVDSVPEFDIRPKSAARIEAEEAVKRFAASNDKCWKRVYPDWETGCYNDVEKSINGMANMLRIVINRNNLNIRVSKRKGALYMLKND